MSEKMDVLAVLSEVPELYTLCTTDPTNQRLVGCAKRIRKARNAIAELIEAAQKATEMVMHDGTSSREACERLDAAWRACVAANTQGNRSEPEG